VAEGVGVGSAVGEPVAQGLVGGAHVEEAADDGAGVGLEVDVGRGAALGEDRATSAGDEALAGLGLPVEGVDPAAVEEAVAVEIGGRVLGVSGS
jgi:hypothetical protein